MNRAELNKAHTKIFESAAEVHTITGPGLPHSIHKACMLQELRLKGLMFKKDVIFPVIYKDLKAAEISIELLVENSIILDIVCGVEITQLEIAAMQSKLKVTGLRMGIIINFNCLSIIDGYRKIMINP